MNIPTINVAFLIFMCVGLYLAYTTGKHVGAIKGFEEGRQFEKDLQAHVRLIKKKTA